MATSSRKRKGRELGWYIRWKEGQAPAAGLASADLCPAKRMLLEIEARVARGLTTSSSPTPNADDGGGAVSDFWPTTPARVSKTLAAYRRGAASRLRRVLPHIGEVRLAELGRAHVIRARDGLSRRYPAGNHAHQPDRADGGLFHGRCGRGC